MTTNTTTSSSNGTAAEMSADDFRQFGRAAIDFIADYMENIRERPVLPSVEPGYLAPLLPTECPREPEPWQVCLRFNILHNDTTIFHCFSPL